MRMSNRTPPVLPPSCLEIEVARIEIAQGWQEEYHWLADNVRQMTQAEYAALRKLCLAAVKAL